MAAHRGLYLKNLYMCVWTTTQSSESQLPEAEMPSKSLAEGMHTTQGQFSPARNSPSALAAGLVVSEECQFR